MNSALLHLKKVMLDLSFKITVLFLQAVLSLFFPTSSAAPQNKDWILGVHMCSWNVQHSYCYQEWVNAYFDSFNRVP